VSFRLFGRLPAACFLLTAGIIEGQEIQLVARKRKAGRPKKNAATPATRDLILKAARQVFADHGYNQASLDEVAKAVNIRVPSLLYHFPTKHSLYEALVADLAADVKRVLDKIDSDQGGPTRKFQRAVIELVEFEKRERALIPIVLADSFTKESPVQKTLTDAIGPMIDRVEIYFKENLDPPLPRKAPFREVAVMFLLAYASRGVLGKHGEKVWGKEDHLLQLALSQMKMLQQWPKG